jgi:hypothetical protein
MCACVCACVRHSLGADDAYRVDGCAPAVPPAVLEPLLERLNSASDKMEFPGFVVEMRRAFKALL